MASFLLCRRLPVSPPLLVTYFLPSFFFHQYLNRFSFNSRLSQSPRFISSTLSKGAAEGIFGNEDTMSALQAKNIISKQEEFAVPKSFPFEIFESVENDWRKYNTFTVTFYRDTSDEKIEVEISASSWVLEKLEDEEANDDGNKANKEDDGRIEKEADDSETNDEDDYLYACEFRVEIDKGNGRKLWFYCRFPGKFAVYKIHTSPEKYLGDWDQVNDADLLKAAQKCLEARGIDSSLAAFAEKYLAFMKRKHDQVNGD